LPLRFTKYHAIKTYGGGGEQLHAPATLAS